jgi:hypothetical protein
MVTSTVILGKASDAGRLGVLGGHVKVLGSPIMLKPPTSSPPASLLLEWRLGVEEKGMARGFSWQNEINNGCY